MINVSKVITDPRVAKTFTIYRKSGEWVSGRFEQTENPMQLTGVISVASAREIEQIPEGDRVGGEIVIHCTQEIFTTHTSDTSSDTGTSDELLWHGDRYKIYSVSPYSDYGYYKAIGQRMASC